MPKLYRPKHPFVGPVDGVPTSFTRDMLIEEGHHMLTVWPELFEEVEPHFKAPEKTSKRSVEAATAAPGEKRNK